MRTERRWFKVRGHYTTDRVTQKPQVEILQVTVPVTGSFYVLMTAATNALLQEHQFFATSIIDHSMKRECL